MQNRLILENQQNQMQRVDTVLVSTVLPAGMTLPIASFEEKISSSWRNLDENWLDPDIHGNLVSVAFEFVACNVKFETLLISICEKIEKL